MKFLQKLIFLQLGLIGLIVPSVISQLPQECGGLLDQSENGEINYKVNETYDDNERCLWTVLAGQKSTIEIQLISAEFQVCALCDFITVYTVNNEGQLVQALKIYTADGLVHSVAGPLIYISFTSNGIGPGKGFSLKYKGTGNDISPDGTSYKLHHFTSGESELSAHYPNTEVLFPPNEFVSFVIQPELNKTIQLTLSGVNNGFNGIYCDRNILTVYEIDLGRVAFRLRYCRNDDEAKTIIKSPQPFLVTFFSSVQQNGTGFSLTWNSKSLIS